MSSTATDPSPPAGPPPRPRPGPHRRRRLRGRRLRSDAGRTRCRSIAADAVAVWPCTRRPYLIGVRHHSPALAAAMPALLDACRRRSVLLVELPPELAPVAAVARRPGHAPRPSRWPRSRRGRRRPGVLPVRRLLPGAGRDPLGGPWTGIPVVAVRPAAGRPGRGERAPGRGPDAGPVFADALRAAGTGRADEDLWDRTVEAPGPGADPEAVRRAALAVGWALRIDAERGAGVSALDLRREARMRRCLAEAGPRRVAALVGAFHAPALLPVGQPPAVARPARRRW